jgi:hypothetical protein
MRTGHYGIPLSIKGGPGHGRERVRREETRPQKKEGGQEKIGRRTIEKLGFREKSVDTYKIYILRACSALPFEKARLLC